MGALTSAVAVASDYARLAAAIPQAAAPSGRPIKKLFFLGYAAVGDLIFTLPALKALREGLPEARIVFAGDRDPGATELLPATGLVDEIWTWTHPELAQESTREEIARRVAAEGFDAVIVNQATPLRPFARAILPIPLRVGHFRALEAPHRGWDPLRYAFWKLKRGVISSEFERRLALNRPVWVRPGTEHAVERNLKLVAALGLEAPEAAQARPKLPAPDAARRWAEERLPKTPSKTVGIHLGAPTSQYMKIWPARRWGRVAQRLAEEYRCRVALIGGAAETAEAAPFLEEFDGDCVNLVGQATLLESFAAISRCDLFLSSDTGLSKAAMALGVPTVSVWGPIDPKETGAIWEKEKHAEVSLGLSCSPCVSMALRNEGSGALNFSNCGHHHCLQMLIPELVVGEINKRFGVLLRG